MILEKVITDISSRLQNETAHDTSIIGLSESPDSHLELEIKDKSNDLSPKEEQRLRSEFLSAGPLENLLLDQSITEIMITNKDNIWFEKNGHFKKHNDIFYTELTYTNFIHKLMDEANIQVSLNQPFADGSWNGFRVHVAAPPITKIKTLTLRRTKSKPFSLQDLAEKNWCSQHQLEKIKELIDEKKNILVIGNTGSGKTTLLNAILMHAKEDRCLIIEDTPEIQPANTFSVNMLTRTDSQEQLRHISQTELVKQSLRMRPDRLIIGEIRGDEAKDLLLALSTGHAGSMGTIHARSPQEALIRLEMLVQMGAPSWSLETIRRLIGLSIERLIVTKKEGSRWHLENIYKISGQESFGFLIDEA